MLSVSILQILLYITFWGGVGSGVCLLDKAYSENAIATLITCTSVPFHDIWTHPSKKSKLGSSLLNWLHSNVTSLQICMPSIYILHVFENAVHKFYNVFDHSVCWKQNKTKSVTNVCVHCPLILTNEIFRCTKKCFILYFVFALSMEYRLCKLCIHLFILLYFIFLSSVLYKLNVSLFLTFQLSFAALRNRVKSFLLISWCVTNGK